MPKSSVSTTMTKSKKCKHSITYRADKANDEVSTALYLMNPSVAKLGNPEQIKVTVEKVK